MKTNKRAISLLTILCLCFSFAPVWASNETDPSLEYIREAWSIHQQLMQQLHDETPLSDGHITASYQLTNFIGRHVSAENLTVPSDAINHRQHSARANDLLTAMASYKTDGFSGENKYTVNTNTNVGTFTSASDKVTVSDAQRTRRALRKAQEIARSIRAQSSDPSQQVRLANRYLGRTITYQDTGTAAHSPGGALLDGKAVCEGYSYAFHMLMNELDIPVVNVYGTSRGQDHMWSKVKINGQWLYCDITWNDSTGGDPSETYLLQNQQDFYSKISHHSESDAMNHIAIELLYRNELEPQARELNRKGLLQGDLSGFRLNDGLSRAEMAVILVNAMGEKEKIEEAPLDYAALCTFTDVPHWAKPYVGYCLQKGLVRGIGGNRYGSNQQASKLDFCTVMLRSSGITGGYTYPSSDIKAVQEGWISQARTALPDLTRGDVVHILTNRNP